MYNDFRKIIIYTDAKKYPYLNQIIENKKIKEGMEDRNIRIDIQKSDSDKVDLYGYDKLLKYTTDKITEEEFKKIFKEIDKMPLRKQELRAREEYESITDSDMQF